MYAIFVDFAKALDSVPWDKLLQFIFVFGVSRNTLKFIFLSLHLNNIKINDGTAICPTGKQNIGVLQCDSLSLSLFNIFVDVLPNILVTLQYTDDIEIYSNNISSTLTALTKCHTWRTSNKLNVNKIYAIFGRWSAL